MTSISQKLALVRQKIEAACQKAGRAPSTVQLIAVSKTHAAQAIEEAIRAGQSVFGENRVQEAEGKFIDIKQRYSEIELHLIGPLQTNKVEQAVALFDVIQTVDRLKLAQSIAKACAKLHKTPRLYIEVNSGNEPQKAGVAPDQLELFLAQCHALGLKIDGLMCIPPIDVDPTPHFARMQRLAQKLNLPHLSMGMSADFEAAIAQGATEVRVGTAIFGHRLFH